jgi:hypothetical protein
VDGVRRRRGDRSGTLAAMAFAGAWLAAGCGGSRALVQPAPQVPPASFALCQAAAGSTLQELGVQEGSPFNLVTANGNLYYALDNGNFPIEAIMRLPLSGGPPVTLAMAEGSQLWLDGQAVDTAALDDKLWQVPLGRGDATLIADGNTTGPPHYNVATSQAFDGTNFYWDLRPQNEMPFWNVWQISVAGGVAQKLADLPIPTGPRVNWTMLETSAYGVLIASSLSRLPAWRGAAPPVTTSQSTHAGSGSHAIDDGSRFEPAGGDESPSDASATVGSAGVRRCTVDAQPPSAANVPDPNCSKNAASRKSSYVASLFAPSSIASFTRA